MTEYRFYTLNTFNAISNPPEIVECANDDDAIEKATQLLDGHSIEVWEGTRVVARLQTEKKSAGSKPGST